MSAEELEREIRRSPTMNERFLLGLLDEARAETRGAAASALRTESERLARAGLEHASDAVYKKSVAISLGGT